VSRRPRLAGRVGPWGRRDAVGRVPTAPPVTAFVPVERLGRPREAAGQGGSALLWLERDSPTRKVVEAIDGAAQRGCRALFLAGDEPTERPDFALLAERAARRGMRLGLCTDGARFSDPEVALGAARAWRLTWVDLRAGGRAAAELAPAARGLAVAGVRVTLTLVASASLRASIGEFAALTGLSAIRVVPDSAEEPAAAAALALELAAQVRAAASAAVEVRVDETPVCLGGSAQSTLPAPWHGAGLGPAIDHDRVKPPACAGCVHHSACAGLPVGAFRRFGDAALRPVRHADHEAGAALRGVPQQAPPPSGYRPPEDSRLDVAPRHPETALVTLMVPGCDLRCIFCDTPQGDLAMTPSTLRGVRASLVAMSGRATGVFFTGGEPTQLPWLLDALRAARELGYRRIQMQSHAGPASDPAFAQALADAGLTAIDVPLYGDNARTHQAVTHTPHSFRRTLAGLEALRALGLRAVVHVTLFAQNLRRLPEILRFIDALAPDAAYLQVSGDVGRPGTYARVAPPPAVLGPAIERAFAEVAPRVPIALADVTPCMVPTQAHRIVSYVGAPEREADPVVLPYGEWLMTFSRGTTRTHAPVCAGCSLRAGCDGLPREALAHFGASALSAR
jgi:MoaA/NifB/PqqE/SkfB family radical SAM enzyme